MPGNGAGQAGAELENSTCLSSAHRIYGRLHLADGNSMPGNGAGQAGAELE